MLLDVDINVGVIIIVVVIVVRIAMMSIIGPSLTEFETTFGIPDIGTEIERNMQLDPTVGRFVSGTYSLTC